MDRTPTAVAACLEALAGEDCRWESAIARRHNSRVHRVRCRGAFVAVKECFQPRTTAPAPEVAEREFAALEALAARPSDPPLAPRPLVLSRRYATYAMTWVPGRPVTERLLARSTGVDAAASLGQAAGCWLRRFHDLGAESPRRGDYESKLATVDEIAARTGLRDPDLRRAATVLARVAPRAAEYLLPASWVHGDMKSDNLLVEGGQMTGLDAHIVHRNTVAYDLAPFLNHLALLRFTPRGVGRQEALDAAADGFLRGYSTETGRWASPIAWLRGYLLLQVAASSREYALPRRWSIGWPARRVLRSVIASLDAST